MARKTVNNPQESKEEPKVEQPEPKKVQYPTVAATGKFQRVAFNEGYVVYNPVGQRVTGVVSENQARDLVLRSNLAAGIK